MEENSNIYSMKRKYLIPYLCVTLPIVGIMTALLFLTGRTESHAAIAVYILVGCVWIPETLLWRLLFRNWCKAPYWRMAEHVTAINISLLLTGGCILLGSNLSDVWSYGLAFVPALIPYIIGFAYIYFFARRNETVYLQKRNYRNESLPLRAFLRKYLPGFLWGDLITAIFTLIFLCLPAYLPVIEQYDRAAFIVTAFVIFTALDRIWKQKLIYSLFGWRSYPSGMLAISTIALIATPFLCFKGEYGLGIVAQVVAVGSYLHVYYLYEQERDGRKNGNQYAAKRK